MKKFKSDSTLSGKEKNHRIIQTDSWEELYSKTNIKNQPWYAENPDMDFYDFCESKFVPEKRILDVGAGPATESFALAKMGYDVTSTDISLSAVKNAKENNIDTSLKIKFVHDDILDTQLSEKYDIIIDRGCFHVLHINGRSNYIKSITKLLNEDGYFLLKCFSTEEPGSWGPHRFSEKIITEIFDPSFEVLEVRDTFYYGNFTSLPKSLFCIMKMKNN